MTHILIVDDEGLERAAMRKIISQAFPNVHPIGEASNGREAIRYVQTASPDLVLMDIKMPGMDGIEAIHEIKLVDPHVRFVMVSAFDTFNYAQKAIREGVKDYLVKPSKKAEIIQTMSRVLDEIEAEQSELEVNKRIRKNYHKALNHIQSDWVASLLLNHIHYESLVLESFSFDQFECFSALALQFNFPNQSTRSTEELSAIYQDIEPIVKSICSGAVGPMMNLQIPVILAFNELQEEGSIQARAIKMADQLLKEIEKKRPELDCRIGLGNTIQEVHLFSESYHQALLALEETTDRVKYLYFHPSILKDTLETKLDETEQALVEVIRSGQVNQLDEAFYSYFKQVSHFYKQDLTMIEHHLDELRIVLNRFLKEWQATFLLPEQAFRAEKLLQLREQAKAHLTTLMQQIHNWQSENVQGITVKAKEWIDTHFTEAVTLDEVAVTVQLSPYYFSKLFKESVGQTFIDYLTQKRMELAKYLLTNTKKTFKEICFEVGYHDPNYFSRVFKKNTGITPSDYRKKGLALK